MAAPDGSLVNGQRLTLMFAGPEERRADAAAVIAAVGFQPEWVGHVRHARNLEVGATHSGCTEPAGWARKALVGSSPWGACCCCIHPSSAASNHAPSRPPYHPTTHSC